MARQLMGGSVKRAFIPSGDMSGGGGGDPAAGGDPTGGAGGAPPGGDPTGGGGGAPPSGDPSGGGGGDPTAIIAQLQQQVQQMQQQMQQMQMGGGGGAGGAGGGALKPKIDVNSVLLSILKVQARIADQLGVKIPASEMVATQQDLSGLATATQTGGPMPGMDPTAGGGGGGGGDAGGVGGVSPVDPMQGMQPGPGGTKQGSYHKNGIAFDSAGLDEMNNRASAIAKMRKISRAS